ncbi:hypothetical protein [Glycomyces arizonensis]|uniref:hypothetical protein n=1 Tax=Glycomyces arizonensis TaxID=256035 RepID=UPI0012EB6E86|nr:hypothetical protein [Glycomyces arizonensis]
MSERWTGLLNHDLTREEVHDWAKPWVEERDDEITDAMVRSALLRLHGFGMVYVDADRTVVRHGSEGPYVHSEHAMAAAFDQWEAKCREIPTQ